MPDADVFTFAGRVRRAMEYAGWNEVQLAAGAGISLKTVQRYLEREDAPNQKAGPQSVARATGVPQDWLLTGEGEGPREPRRRGAAKPNGRPRPLRPKHDGNPPAKNRRDGDRAYLVGLSVKGVPFLAYDMNAGRWINLGDFPTAELDPDVLSSLASAAARGTSQGAS